MKEAEAPLEPEHAIRWFADVKASEVPQVGVKGQRLGLLYQQRFPVPPGCIITTRAHRAFLQHAKLETPLHELLQNISELSDDELKEKSAQLQETLLQAPFPAGFEEALQESCELLNTNPKKLKNATASALLILQNSYEFPFLAVRSSPLATAVSLPSFLNVKGMSAVLSAIRQCYASLLTPQALREHAAHFQGELPLLAIILQTMIDAEISGLITPPATVPASSYTLRATWGLGELLQESSHTPDTYDLRKEREIFTIRSANAGEKKHALTRNSAGTTVRVPLSEKRSKQQLLNPAELYALARLADAVAQHFQEPHQLAFSMLAGECSLLSCMPWHAPAEQIKKTTTEAATEQTKETAAAQAKEKDQTAEALALLFGDAPLPSSEPSEEVQHEASGCFQHEDRAPDDIESIILRELEDNGEK